MKRITALALLSLTGAIATAEPVSLKTETGIDAGLQISSYRYQEPDLMRLSGNKLGLVMSGTRTFDAFFVSGALRHASGDVDYSSVSTGSSPAHADRLWELRASIGRDFDAGAFVVAPYVGLGYRVLDNDLRGYSSTGSVGYRRKSEYNFLALGATHRMPVGDRARLVTTLEYNHLLSGEQTSYMSELGPAYAAVFGDPVNKQEKGNGLRLSVDYEMSNWSVGAFASLWKIEDSNVNTYTDGFFLYSLREPRNTTREFGMAVKYKF